MEPLWDPLLCSEYRYVWFIHVEFIKISYIGDLIQSSVYTGFNFIQSSVYTGFNFIQSSVYTGFNFIQSSVYTGFNFIQSSVYTGFGLNRFYCICKNQLYKKYFVQFILAHLARRCCNPSMCINRPLHW